MTPSFQPTLLALAVVTLAHAGAQAQTPPAPSTLEAVTVTGQAASWRKALAIERKAFGVVSAISADDIGALPDTNAAEALARLPGIALQRDQGEGRYVVVRGLGPDLNAVTLNGATVPAPEGSRRGLALDTLPAGMVRTLAVIKSLAPEHDAGSLGGTVSIETLSAFDVNTPLLSAGLGLSRDGNTGQNSPNGQVLYADRYADGRFGLALGASLERRDFGSDNVETGGAWTNGRLSGFEQRDYRPNRERGALAASLDWRPHAGQSWRLRGLVSRFSDDEVRDRLTVSNVANTATTPGGTFVEGQTVTGRAERRLRQRKYTQDIQALTLGTAHQWGDWALDAELGLGRASEDTPESINDARFRQNNVAGLSFTNTQAPRLQGPANLYDPALFNLNAFTLQARESADHNRHAKLDVARDFVVEGKALEVKLGAKATQRTKTNDTNQWAYNSSNASSGNYWGAGATTLAGFAGAEVDYALGRVGAGIDPRLVRERLAGLARDPARLARESAFNDFRMTEDVDAAYVQAQLDVAPQWQLLGGVRLERTHFAAEGSRISASGTVTPTRTERSDHHWLPGLHLRGALTPHTTLRAAAWQGLVRANFGQLAPGVNLSSATEATIGNPELRPLRARNLDLGVEQALGRDGALSVYAFHKAITDYTYTTNLAGTGPWAAYTSAVTYANGDQASVRGLELSYTQPLRMLPGALSGLVVGANATFSRSAAVLGRYDRTAGATLTRRIALPGQADKVFNLIVGYEQGPFSARVAVNQKSPYLLELGGDLLDANQERWVDRQRQVDASIAWQIDRRWSLKVEGLNLNNEVYYVYQGSRPFNTQYEQYGRTLKVSLTAKAF